VLLSGLHELKFISKIKEDTLKEIEVAGERSDYKPKQVFDTN
jgi:hypothetical protein